MFSSKPKVIQVWGDDASVNILFVIPIIVTIQGHMFAIYTNFYEIHDNVGLV